MARRRDGLDANPDSQAEIPMESLSQAIWYTYQPLPCDGKFIRLLHLEPASNARVPLRAALTIERLRPEVFYEALSYCWGDLAISESIQVDSQRFAVTTNLAAALRAIRRSIEPRVLWIDAICIDQSNIEEKNRQVSLMREIYANSCITIVWQGPSDEWSRKRLSLPEYNFWNHWTMWFDFVDAIRPTVDRPWMSRIWVVQEVAYSRNITVCFGYDRCTWKHFPEMIFAAFLDQGINPRLACQYRAMKLMRKEIADGNRLEIADALRMFRIYDATRASDKVFAILGLLHRPGDVIIDYNKDHRDVYRDLALDIISQTQSLDILGDALQKNECVDPNGMRFWIPDWSYTGSVSHLPPALSPIGDVTTKTSATYEVFHASRNSFEMPILQPDGTLAVNVQVIAHVEEISVYVPGFSDWLAPLWSRDSLIPAPRDMLQTVRSIIELYRDWRDLASRINGPSGTLHDRYVTGHTIGEAFYFTCSRFGIPATHKASLKSELAVDILEWSLAKMDWWYNHASLKLPHILAFLITAPLTLLLMLGAFLKFSRRIFDGIISLDSDSFERMLREAYEGGSDTVLTAIGRTDNGLLGMFPGPTLFERDRLTTIRGDSVVLLQGASMPFVIRKSGEHWRLVGEAYIHGIMFGAAFQRGECERITLC